MRRLAPLLVLVLASTAAADTLTGKVIHVADGDTITVLSGKQQVKVRLAGIDAPERGQPYGKTSGRSLAAIVAGKQARIHFNKRDRYGRIVGRVWVLSPDTRCTATPCQKNLDAGLYQLTVGMAWWYRKYADEQTPEARGQYEFAAFEAKAKRAGLWQEPGAIPPFGIGGKVSGRLRGLHRRRHRRPATSARHTASARRWRAVRRPGGI